MSATKIIFKRSSILGKRPTNQLEPGEIGLNTNSTEPGLFFDTTDGRVVKVGPTAVLPLAPVEFPERGETWLDTSSGNLKVGDEFNSWRSIATPYLGGGVSIVFVCPNSDQSSDSIFNDGQSIPFQTITRALLEVSKNKIINILNGRSANGFEEKYVIMAAPSAFTPNNNPGTTADDFSVVFNETSESEVTIAELVQFNPVDGGVIVPGGVSIRGVDLKKCAFNPTYVPTYKHPGYPDAYAGTNQPLSSIFKVSGNVFCESFTLGDKVQTRNVNSVISRETIATFVSPEPHGLSKNDLVQVTFAPTVDQSTGTFVSGFYYAVPINTFQFQLSNSDLDEQGSTGTYIPFSSLPVLTSTTGTKLIVSNIIKSAHRLAAFRYASFEDLADYYTKVQKAFPVFFGGKVTSGAEIVRKSEHVIVAPTEMQYPDNLASNSTQNSSCYIRQVNLRSGYGMTFGDFNGNDVEGFRSLISNECTSVSIQSDPAAYEVYTILTDPATGASEQRWWTLVEATYYSLPVEERPSTLDLVPDLLQNQILNQTSIENIRYHYKNLSSADGLSFGIVDIDNDFRHFGFRARNSAYLQAQSIYSIGCAIGVWALNGGIISLTNSTTNFGSVAFKSEGFRGINTIEGARLNSKGFVLEGVQRPLALTKSQTEALDNKKILSLGGKINSIYIDPLNPSIQIVELNSDFLPCYLLPYSLKPDSAIWVETETCTYRGFLATDGGPTVVLGLEDPIGYAKLRIRSSDSTIPNDETLFPALGVPYIRRFSDPRQEFERSYSLFIRNTFPNAVAPQVGSVLRLNQTSQQLGSSSLRPNVQFDPGILGGWGRVFTVGAIETGNLGSSPQFNYVIGNANQDLTYYIAITASDYSRPWGQGTGFNLPSGSYTTYRNKNWYTAENNLWSNVYYGDASTFTENFGPYSIAPTESCSPFVETSVLEKQDPVSLTFQGTYATDSYLTEEGYINQSYFRGSTNPYPTYASKGTYDGDDGSESLGLCLKDIADGAVTYTVSLLTTVQTEQLASLTPTPQRYRPAVVEFSVLTPTDIPNPRQTISIIQLGTGSNVEYMRVVNLNGSIVTGIRLSYENSFYKTTLPNNNWPQRTRVTVCSTSSLAEPGLYDPDWGNTKSAIFRFFEIMGYSRSIMEPVLTPHYWGERLLPVLSLNGNLPLDGYALRTDKWPLEFNQPSLVTTNTHTWAYAVYYSYSRGLPEYQSSDFARKLAADYQATTTWSGKLTVTGVNDKGEIVQFGPQKQALTANFFESLSPVANLANQQIYEEQPYVEFPSQVVIYSADDISSSFNGLINSFDLTRSLLPIPPDQLSVESLFVTLGAVIQKPGVDYELFGNSIQFSEPPVAGLSCNVRVVTSNDFNRTLVVLTFGFLEPFDGTRTIFTAQTDDPNILAPYEVTANGTFVFLGGVEQIPLSDVSPSLAYAYSIERTSPTTVQFTFTGAPPAGTTLDVRAICSGFYWSQRSMFPVEVYSLDPLTDQFDGAETSFTLKYNNKVVNAALVSVENLIISLGGAIQIPGESYTIENSVLTFSQADPPQAGTTTNLRVIGNSEFIPCNSGTMAWGPSVIS